MGLELSLTGLNERAHLFHCQQKTISVGIRCGPDDPGLSWRKVKPRDVARKCDANGDFSLASHHGGPSSGWSLSPPQGLPGQ